MGNKSSATSSRNLDFTSPACADRYHSSEASTSSSTRPSRLKRLRRWLRRDSKKISEIALNEGHFSSMIAAWKPEEIYRLYLELESGHCLWLLRREADGARPVIGTLLQQLRRSPSNFEFRFKDFAVPCHRIIVILRCDFINKYLTENPKSKFLDMEEVLTKSKVNENTFKADRSSFESFVNFLYTEKFDGNGETFEVYKKLVGCQRSLTADLHRLKSLRGSGDFVVRLSPLKPPPDKEISETPTKSLNSRMVCFSELLSARSSYLRNLIEKNEGELVLNSDIIPKEFLSCLEHFLYSDLLDLGMVEESACSSSLSEARAIVAGQSPNSLLCRGFQMFSIARVLGMDGLAQLCEDVIVKGITIENFLRVMTWASENGSEYVHRHCEFFLETKFVEISKTHTLFEISEELLLSAVKSDLIQATEMELLSGILRWGEHALLKNIEAREPNLVADTSHSVSRSGVRRNECSEAELKEILRPFLDNLRTHFVLPPFNELIDTIYERGLLERQPLLKNNESVAADALENPDCVWFLPDDWTAGPRCYLPYLGVIRKAIANLPQDFDPTKCLEEYALCSPLLLVIKNTLPDVIPAETFNEVKEEILSKLADLRTMSPMKRAHHRLTAVKLTALLVLRSHGVDPKYIVVELDEKKNLSTAKLVSEALNLWIKDQDLSSHDVI